MLQYKIPQNVGIEDKIVGPFSLRQLIILAVGGGISYLIFIISSRLYELNILEYLIIAIPALFALAIAMIKIHHVTFSKYLLLMLEFAIKPKRRMWDHRGIAALVSPDLTEHALDQKAAAAAAEAAKKGQKNVNLSDLSAMLDSGGFDNVQVAKHEDIDEAKDEDLITEAYFGHKKKEGPTQNMYWRTKEVQKKKLDLLAKLSKAPAKPAGTPKAPVQAVAPTQPPPTTPSKAPAQPTASVPPQKKESVAEHLAGVIKEARENNKEQTTVATEVQTETQKARRRRKPKKVAQPVRADTQINTMDKTMPVVQPKPIEQVIHADDLKQGNEIEFNLD